MIKSKVRAIQLTGTSAATIESEINAVITVEEAAGFVIESTLLVGAKLLLTFKRGDNDDKFGGLEKVEIITDYQRVSTAALFRVGGVPDIPDSHTPLFAVVEVTTPWVGPGIATITCQVGIIPDPDGFQVEQDISTSGIKGDAGAALMNAVTDESTFGGVFRVVSTGANLDQLTAGELKVSLFFIRH